MTLADSLERKILALEDVHAQASRWGGKRAYFVGANEFAHWETETALDIRLTHQAIQTGKPQLRLDGRVKLRRGRSDWFEFTLSDKSDLKTALEWLEKARQINRE